MSSYPPNNLCVYIYAQAGCMGALIAARNQPTDPNEADYADAAERADFFAQEIDTIWGVGSYTNADLQQIQSAAASLWAGGRSPVPGAAGLTAAGYTGIAQAIIAGVKAGTAQIVAEGINPNGCGGGGGGTVTSVTGSAPIVITGSAASPNVTITAATDAAAGSMSAADKTKLDNIPVGGFPIREQANGPASPTNVPITDGDSAAIVSLPAFTGPIGSRLNITGYVTLTNTQAEIRACSIAVELVLGAGSVGALQKSSLAASEADRAVPFNVDYVTTTLNPVLTLSVWCTTGGASSGDVTVQGNNCTVVSTQVG